MQDRNTNSKKRGRKNTKTPNRTSTSTTNIFQNTTQLNISMNENNIHEIEGNTTMKEERVNRSKNSKNKSETEKISCWICGGQHDSGSKKRCWEKNQNCWVYLPMDICPYCKTKLSKEVCSRQLDYHFVVLCQCNKNKITKRNLCEIDHKTHEEEIKAELARLKINRKTTVFELGNREHNMKCMSFHEFKDNGIRLKIQSAAKCQINKLIFSPSLSEFEIIINKCLPPQTVKEINNNRQHHDRLKLELKESNIDNDGWGVFANTKIDPNSIICEYLGRVESNETICTKNKGAFEIGYFAHVKTKKIKLLLIDADYVGNIGYYINGSDKEHAPNCEANLYAALINNEMELMIIITSSRIIEIGEELLFDYGPSYNLQSKSDSSAERQFKNNLVSTDKKYSSQKYENRNDFDEQEREIFDSEIEEECNERERSSKNNLYQFLHQPEQKKEINMPNTEIDKNKFKKNTIEDLQKQLINLCKKK